MNSAYRAARTAWGALVGGAGSVLAGGLVCGLVVVAPRVAGAQERPTLAGTWSASAMSERWVVGDWGEACGPRPAPRGAGGGQVQISEGGGELTFSGGGYPRTSGCFEMGGGIAVTSHSGGARGWQTRCSTPKGDPRQANIVTSVTATDSLISFDETGQYQFVLKEQNCTASVRRSRTYTLVRRQGEAEPTPSASTPPPVEVAAPPPAATIAAAPKPVEPEVKPREPEAHKVCSGHGEPARVEVRPRRKVLKPGETFSARGVVLDANACPVPLALVWSVSPPSPGVTVSPAGVVSIAADAAEREYTVLAGVSGKAAGMTVEVVSVERYAQLLASGLPNAGDDLAPSVAVVASGAVGSGAAVADDGAGQRRGLFLGVVGVVVLALGAVGAVLMRRQRVEHDEVEELVPGETTTQVVRKKRLVARSSDAPPMACPTCSRGFPEGSAFCPHDGVALVRATRPVAVSASMVPAPARGAAKVCPVCGQRFAAGARFCGREGAALIDAG